MGNDISRPIVLKDHDPNVPPSLQFSRHRKMVIASVFSQTRKYLCFSTLHSYEKFKSAGRKVGTQQNLDDDGLGVPVFEFEDPYAISRMMKQDGVRFRIYKFVLQSPLDPIPHPNSTVVCQDKQKVIYKIPFCEVCRHYSGFRLSYSYTFFTPEGLVEVLAKKHKGVLDLDTRLGEWNVTWRHAGCGNYDLVVLPSSAPSLLDDKEIRKNKARAGGGSDAHHKGAVVWAKYWGYREAFLPHFTRKLATLDVGEVPFETDAAEYGLRSIPWYSQVIACMAMVQCQVQQERSRRRNRNSSTVN
ncbi:LADA_0H19878g1_1 [Lachancea dasiensis]|uniref:LADA_0H19878g1_1 n=1 Tax=Lachancea dasiensis TaxID=1072105 RepID=A0A1G4K6H4_9SACH|nr:LADA_0H19878g1_1 [Lachancea dasiensis]